MDHDRPAHPDLAGVGAVLSADPADAEFYRRQRDALVAATRACDGDEKRAEWAVRAYLRSMRESEPAR